MSVRVTGRTVHQVLLFNLGWGLGFRWPPSTSFSSNRLKALYVYYAKQCLAIDSKWSIRMKRIFVCVYKQVVVGTILSHWICTHRKIIASFYSKWIENVSSSLRLASFYQFSLLFGWAALFWNCFYLDRRTTEQLWSDSWKNIRVAKINYNNGSLGEMKRYNGCWIAFAKEE